MREESFKKLNASVRLDLVKKWEEVDDTPRMNPVTKEIISVHEAKFKTGGCHVVFSLVKFFDPMLAPPTQKKAYQALLAREVNHKLAGLKSGCGFTQLVNDGLHLEHDQYVVKFAKKIRVAANCLKSRSCIAKLSAATTVADTSDTLALVSAHLKLQDNLGKF